MPTLLEQEVQEQSVVAAGLEQFNKPHFLFSVHYMAIKEERDYKTKVRGAYRTVYPLARVAKKGDRPSMLVVKDGYQRVFRRTDTQTGKRMFGDEPEYAKHIAHDIVRVATGTDSSDESAQRPAVWISQATRLPLTDADWAMWDTPAFAAKFPELMKEYEWAIERQWTWCEGKVKEADNFFVEDKHIYIGVQHRRAAEWIGANAAEHRWIKATALGVDIPCPECGAKTSAIAPRCSNCNEIINVQAYVKWKTKRDAELKIALKAAEDAELEQQTAPVAKPKEAGNGKNSN